MIVYTPGHGHCIDRALLNGFYYYILNVIEVALAGLWLEFRAGRCAGNVEHTMLMMMMMIIVMIVVVDDELRAVCLRYMAQHLAPPPVQRISSLRVLFPFLPRVWLAVLGRS